MSDDNGSALGLDNSAEADFAAALEDNQETVSTEETPEAVEETPAADDPVEQPEQDAEPTPDEPDADEPGLLLGKFKTPEQLEQAYRMLESKLGRLGAEKGEANRKLAELEAQLQAQNAQLEQMAQLTQAQLAETNPEAAEQLRAQQAQAAEVARVRQEAYEASQQAINAEAAKLAAQAAVTSFAASHPDFRPGNKVALAMRQVIEHFGAKGPDWALDDTSPDTLEVSYRIAKQPELLAAIEDLEVYPTSDVLDYVAEAVQDPALRTVLRTNPAYMESEETMKLARQLAAQSRPAEPMTEQRTTAHVETGGSASPLSSAPDGDIVAEMLEMAAKERSSILGI